jgi:hypothetical protein
LAQADVNFQCREVLREFDLDQSRDGLDRFDDDGAVSLPAEANQAARFFAGYRRLARYRDHHWEKLAQSFRWVVDELRLW